MVAGCDLANPMGSLDEQATVEIEKTVRIKSVFKDDVRQIFICVPHETLTSALSQSNLIQNVCQCSLRVGTEKYLVRRKPAAWDCHDHC